MVIDERADCTVIMEMMSTIACGCNVSTYLLVHLMLELTLVTTLELAQKVPQCDGAQDHSPLLLVVQVLHVQIPRAPPDREHGGRLSTKIQVQGVATPAHSCNAKRPFSSPQPTHR